MRKNELFLPLPQQGIKRMVAISPLYKNIRSMYSIPYPIRVRKEYCVPAKKFITRLVNLEPLDYKIVRDYADEKGLGRKGFSAALRMILRDWFSLRLIAKNSSWFPKIYEEQPRIDQ